MRLYDPAGYFDSRPADNRRFITTQLNLNPRSRQELAELYGEVWDADELRRDFEVIQFAAPLVLCKRGGVLGSVLFQHHPRLYFSWEPKNQESIHGTETGRVGLPPRDEDQR